MSVIRQARRSAYTVVDNTSIKDPRLSLRAKGLHLVLLSKPNDWAFSSERLADECLEGRDAIRTALRELKTIGYIREVREQVMNGHWKTFTEVYEVPAEEVPVSPSGRVGVEIRAVTDLLETRRSVEPATGEPGDKESTDNQVLMTKEVPSLRSGTPAHDVLEPLPKPAATQPPARGRRRLLSSQESKPQAKTNLAAYFQQALNRSQDEYGAVFTGGVDRNALAGAFKRLRAEGISDETITDMIDRWSRRPEKWVKTIHPSRDFCRKDVQTGLLNLIKSAEYREAENCFPDVPVDAGMTFEERVAAEIAEQHEKRRLA